MLMLGVIALASFIVAFDPFGAYRRSRERKRELALSRVLVIGENRPVATLVPLLLDNGLAVSRLGDDYNPEADIELEGAFVQHFIPSVKPLVDTLLKPRIVFGAMDTGSLGHASFQALLTLLEPGDIFIDFKPRDSKRNNFGFLCRDAGVKYVSCLLGTHIVHMARSSLSDPALGRVVVHLENIAATDDTGRPRLRVNTRAGIGCNVEMVSKSGAEEWESEDWSGVRRYVDSSGSRGV